jgi:hypothetical protein
MGSVSPMKLDYALRSKKYECSFFPLKGCMNACLILNEKIVAEIIRPMRHTHVNPYKEVRRYQ